MALNDASPGHAPHDSGWSAGDSVRVQELESENRELVAKLTSASQRVAECENEKRTLEARVRQLERRLQRQDALPEEEPEDGGVPGGGGGGQTSSPPPATKPGMARSFSFMSARKPVPTASITPLQKEKELEAALVKEQTLRIAAEKKVRDLDAEVEELSESLFQQANEMVAAERKKNADLDQRVKELENEIASFDGASAENPVALQKENARLKEKVSVLEQREVERKRRLEKIEAAAKQMERVKTLLLPR